MDPAEAEAILPEPAPESEVPVLATPQAMAILLPKPQQATPTRLPKLPKPPQVTPTPRPRPQQPTPLDEWLAELDLDMYAPALRAAGYC